VWGYILHRFQQMFGVLFIASIVVFLMLRMMPGDTAVIVAGADATDEQLEAVRQELGLDRPLVIQYVVWIGQVLHGNLGRSAISKLPVTDLIIQSASPTIELAVAALLLSVPLGILFGVVSAVKQGTRFDYISAAATSLGIAVPNFWLALLLIMLFAVMLGWLPPGGRVPLTEHPLTAFRFLLLPALTLALPSMMSVGRLAKATVLEVLHEDYVRTARSKGLGEIVVLTKHVLRNALVPISTHVAIQVGHLLSGAVVVESIFGWPGLGLLTLSAITNHDYLTVQATLLLFVVVCVLINLLVDLFYAVVDPRVRVGLVERSTT
jgi:peptide/nickel transport system permease protein